MNKPLLKRLAFFSVAALVLVVAVLATLQMLAKKRALESLPVNTKMGGNFVLPSTLGRPLDLSSLHGKVVLLNFGFASCPDVCPLVLARLRQVLREAGPDAAKLQVVFVSFDPARDTLPLLTAYVQHFSPDIIGATGTDAEIATVAARYGVVYLKENNGSASGYDFAHSDYIYLLDSQGRVRKLYSSDAKTADMAADVRLLLRADNILF
ncbi:MAG: SCO family protein [bacterium]|nr:SCO family protein [bacterium]